MLETKSKTNIKTLVIVIAVALFLGVVAARIMYPVDNSRSYIEDVVPNIRIAPVHYQYIYGEIYQDVQEHLDEPTWCNIDKVNDYTYTASLKGHDPELDTWVQFDFMMTINEEAATYDLELYSLAIGGEYYQDEDVSTGFYYLNNPDRYAQIQWEAEKYS